MNIWSSIEKSGFDLLIGMRSLFAASVLTREVMPSDQILRGRTVKLYKPGARDEQGRWHICEDVSVSFGHKEMVIK